MTLTIKLPKPASIIYAGFFLASIWVFASAFAELVAP